MPNIKTREIDRTPKIRDTAARLTKELVRDIAVKSGDSIKSSVFSSAIWRSKGVYVRRCK